MAQHGETTPFGHALGDAISEAKITQRKLAAQLEIDPSSVSRWVTGKVVPHHEMVDRLQELLGADLTTAFEVSAPTYELYVSAPIMGLADSELGSHRDSVAIVVNTLRSQVNSLYWPGEHIANTDDLAAPDVATEDNMKALDQCTAFIYLQFAEIIHPSSALVELGCALGRRIKTTVMLLQGVRNPFMLEGFQGVAERVPFLPKARIYHVRDARHASDLLEKDGRRLLGLA